MRDGAEAMNANLLIDVQRARTDQCRQFTGGLTPLQIHLEKPVLRMKKTERAGHVFSRLACDRGNAECVAFDLDSGASIRRWPRCRRVAAGWRAVADRA